MDRFWTKFAIGGPDDCWEWQANRHRQGYGFFGLDGRNQLAHRVSYFLTHGVTLPPSIKVLHKCDNPSCVNPNHLEAGTQADNCRDMIAKGRYVNASKLTAEQVRAIRKDPRTCSEIASELGMSESGVYYARRGLNWKNIDNQADEPVPAIFEGVR